MSREHFGVVNTPVYRASTILYPNLAAQTARDAPYTYGRRGTPSSRSFEDAIDALEGGARTVVVPSGLNAISTPILTLYASAPTLPPSAPPYSPPPTFST